MRRSAKIDRNQPAIVSALRRVGATVQSLGQVGKGCPDLLVGYRNRNFLMEIKDGELVPSARQLNDDQLIWQMGWKGQVDTVLNVEKALEIIGWRVL